MKWKNQDINKYSEIILSDCQIEKIQKEGNNIIVFFSEYGFIVKNYNDNKFYRTDGAQIVVKECEMDELSIKRIKTQQSSAASFCEAMYDIEPVDLLTKINSNDWKMEVVEEYYSVNGGYYITKINTKESSFWCHIKIRFESLVYMWNGIRKEWPIE